MFTFSERATNELLKSAEVDEFNSLRISVESAGCSGYRYSIAIDPSKDAGDTVINVDGIAVFVDPESLSLLDGATVDFSDDNGGGFVFNNPNAKAKVKCGCGSGSGH